MADQKPATVLWPDLSRFGLELTVAFNPSLGRNLLRLAVMDRDAVLRNSGLVPGKDDFLRIMREIGFAYVPSEVEARRLAAYWDATHRGASPDEQDEATEREIAKLYFYSPSIAIRKDLLKKFVPALEDGDFRQMPLSQIKHFDFRYIDDAQARALFKGQQAFDGGEPGVFYSTPADRALIARLAEKGASVHEALHLAERAHPMQSDPVQSDVDLAALSALHGVPSVQRLFGGQAQLADGAALRTITAQALIIAYPRYEDAVSANGGDVEGVERVQLPDGLPVAFDYPGRRLAVVRDGRFLEFGRALNRTVSDLEEQHGAQFHWSFLDRVAAVGREVEAATAAGIFEEASLTGPGIDVAAEAADRLRGLMREAVKDIEKYGSGETLSWADVLVHSGLRHSALPQAIGVDLSRFLTEFPALSELIERKRAARDADQALAAGVRDALSKVESADGEPGTRRREDAGEKIGGARKDYARRWLVVDELDTMTIRERAEVVTKDNVWPAPDYAAMEAEGVAPEVAYCIRELRNALPTNPYRGGYNVRRRNLQSRASRDLTLEQCESFVRSVALVRDALANVKTKEELFASIVEIHRNSGRSRYHWHEDHWFFDGSGFHFSARVLPTVNFNAADEPTEMSGCYDFNRFVHVGAAKTEGGWAWAGRKQRAKAAPEDGAEAKKKPEPEVPHLDHIVRNGADYRQGKDVDEQLLMEVFGFRGVEYGNWLPQGERQVVLNHAFDAFMDLASVLKLPPRAMSLGGELAIAFGARGRGGKRAAAAHYEPARNVINLTRLAGAGVLAHEWGHALDYFLAKSCEVSEMRSLAERKPNELRSAPKLANAFVGLVDEASRRYRSFDEVMEGVVMIDTPAGKKSITDLLHSRFEDIIAQFDGLLPEDKRGGIFREFAVRELEKTLVPDPEDARLVCVENFDDFMRNITTALDLQLGKEWRERLHKDALRYPARLVDWAAKRRVQADLVTRQYDARMYPAESRFLEDGKYFDSFRSKPYWSTRVELFARMFEAWVQDSVEQEPGRSSQYLVHGRQERPTADHSGYPRGEERARIATALTRFFDDHRPELLRRLGVAQPEASEVLEAA